MRAKKSPYVHAAKKGRREKQRPLKKTASVAIAAAFPSPVPGKERRKPIKKLSIMGLLSSSSSFTLGTTRRYKNLKRGKDAEREEGAKHSPTHFNSTLIFSHLSETLKKTSIYF